MFAKPGPNGHPEIPMIAERSDDASVGRQQGQLHRPNGHGE